MSHKLVLTTEAHHTCKNCGSVDRERMEAVNAGYTRDHEYLQKSKQQVTAHQGKLALSRLDNRKLQDYVEELEEEIFDLEESLVNAETFFLALADAEGATLEEMLTQIRDIAEGIREAKVLQAQAEADNEEAEQVEETLTRR